MTRASRFWRMSCQDRTLLLEASVLLSLAELAAHTLPFHRIIRLARLLRTNAVLSPKPVDTAPVRRVRWAVRTATRHLPWRCQCLAQALTAHTMLARRGAASTLYIGVRLGEQRGLSSHAWLRCGSIYVTGAPEHQRFRIIATFGGGKT
jgi:Transglutaminase-like superfamily